MKHEILRERSWIYNPVTSPVEESTILIQAQMMIFIYFKCSLSAV